MEAHKLGAARIKYDIDGTEYLVRKPTFNESEMFTKEFETKKSSDPIEQLECILDYVSVLGISKDVLKNLTMDDINQIMEDIAPKKAKSVQIAS